MTTIEVARLALCEKIQRRSALYWEWMHDGCPKDHPFIRESGIVPLLDGSLRPMDDSEQ